MTMNRRSFGKLAASFAAAPLFARSAFAQDVLRVTHFGGPYGALADISGKPFEALGLGSVEYMVEQSSVIFSKWQVDSADPFCDVGQMIPSFALRCKAADLSAPVERSDFPNLAEAVPQAFPEQAYGILQLLDSLTIMYDKRQLAHPIESWLDLWRPDLAGKIAMPALPLSEAPMSMIVVTARAMGGSEKNDEHVDAAFRKLAELKNNVRVFYPDPIQATQMLERGEIVAALQYGARIGQAMRANDFIGRAAPKEGMVAAGQSLVIAKNSPRIDMAKAYLNHVLSEPVQKAMAEQFLIAPVNRNVKISDDLAPLVNNDYEKMIFLDDTYIAQKLPDWMDRYRREVQS